MSFEKAWNSLKAWMPVIWLGLILLVHILITPGNLSNQLQKIDIIKHTYDFLISCLTKPYIF